ncbi:MAG: family 20 glycosylhydrolase [Dysgonamonadaceae bacterium]
MKKVIITIALFICVSLAFSQDYGLIPKPLELFAGQGFFTVDSKTQIIYNDKSSIKNIEFLNAFLDENYNVKLKTKQSSKINKGINFILDNKFDNEQYELNINDNQVIIKGGNAGLFYGLQTLLQLMPLEKSKRLLLPQLEINDKPRFSYRGAMLDVGRYFFTPNEVKRFIDLMSDYKLNVFHWHLTEDAGWRIEIKKYPLLTQIGAWRRGTQQDHSKESFNRLPHGGFYTQDQIKDIVAYAEDRKITIIPEIDMPGHTMSILAAYPEISCSGGPFKVLETWGIQEEILCAGNEQTYQFVEDVLDELIDLFPSEIIHIGGDEAPKTRWHECLKCQAKIKSENLKDEHELQSYFIKRIGSYLQTKGKKMLGWDEIMEGGIASNAMIMSWRGEKGGIEAANLHHEVVMAPSNYMYIDYYQGNSETEPVNIGGNLPLEKVYNYEPLSSQISVENQKYVIGLQGNLWAEFVHSETKADYMAYPRLLAVAEIGWSDAKKDYSDFQKRMSQNLMWLEKKNVNYRIPEPIGFKDVESTEKRIIVDLVPSIQESIIYYTLNGDDPLIHGKEYDSPFSVSLSEEKPVEIKCVVRTKKGRVSGTYSAKYSLKK